MHAPEPKKKQNCSASMSQNSERFALQPQGSTVEKKILQEKSPPFRLFLNGFWVRLAGIFLHAMIPTIDQELVRFSSYEVGVCYIKPLLCMSYSIVVLYENYCSTGTYPWSRQNDSTRLSSSSVHL